MPSAYVRYFTTENSEATERLSPLLSSFFSLCPQFSLWFKLFLVPAEGRSVLQGRKNLKFFPDNCLCFAQRYISPRRNEGHEEKRELLPSCSSCPSWLCHHFGSGRRPGCVLCGKNFPCMPKAYPDICATLGYSMSVEWVTRPSSRGAPPSQGGVQKSKRALRSKI